jgi:hypothetical protein
MLADYGGAGWLMNEGRPRRFGAGGLNPKWNSGLSLLLADVENLNAGFLAG